MKTKTELQIAKELWGKLRRYSCKYTMHWEISAQIEQHLSDCERWLKWLSYANINQLVYMADIGACHKKDFYIEEKRKDIQDAINYHKERLK